MWQHEILYAIEFMWQFNNSDFFAGLSNISTGSTVFSLGQIENFGKIHKRAKNLYDTAQLIHMPYDSVLFFYTDKSNIGTIRRALFCRYANGDKSVIQVTSFSSFPENKKHTRWCLYPVHLLYSGNNKVGVLYDYDIGKIIPHHSGINESNVNAYLQSQEVWTITRNESLSLEYFLMLLNCKNVHPTEVKPSEKVNKKRVKNGKLPMYTYHVLEVSSISDGKKTAGDSDKNIVGETNRLHICRGHFKQYSEQKPLFGKYEGLYWWQPSLRGSVQKGVVDKDYSIKAQT